MPAIPLLKRVVIENYKSILSCDVSLGPLTFLVGLNGSGKSNFIDALRFCRDALRGTLKFAFAERRNGVRSLTHQSRAELGFSLTFEIDFGSGGLVEYTFSIDSDPPARSRVLSEACSFPGSQQEGFSVRLGVLEKSGVETSPERLYLVQASALPEFRPVYDFLSDSEFYDPQPAAMKPGFETPEPSGILKSDGANIANVLDGLQTEDPGLKSRIYEYMQRILPGLSGIDIQKFADKMVNLQFTQGELQFFPEAMSDGTLRALAILVALFQNSSGRSSPSFITIEEPETGLHPAAAGILLAALQEASSHTQVIVTSHSADLLDTFDVDADSLLAVDSVSGATRIGPVDAAAKQTLETKLFSPGELLRMNKLHVQADAFFEGEPGKLIQDQPS